MNDEKVIRLVSALCIYNEDGAFSMWCGIAHMMQPAKEAPPIMQLKTTPHWLMMFMENVIFSILFLEVYKYSVPLASRKRRETLDVCFVSNGVVKVTLWWRSKIDEYFKYLFI